MKTECCFINCNKPAEWGIHPNGIHYTLETYSCSAHLAEMLEPGTSTVWPLETKNECEQSQTSTKEKVIILLTEGTYPAIIPADGISIHTSEATQIQYLKIAHKIILPSPFADRLVYNCFSLSDNAAFRLNLLTKAILGEERDFLPHELTDKPHLITIEHRAWGDRIFPTVTKILPIEEKQPSGGLSMNTETKLQDFTFQGHTIPLYMHKGIINYIEHHQLPGHFLQAIICNDLKQACERADSTNLFEIPTFVAFFYNEAPGVCYGSREKMAKWLETRV